MSLTVGLQACPCGATVVTSAPVMLCDACRKAEALRLERKIRRLKERRQRFERAGWLDLHRERIDADLADLTARLNAVRS